MFLKKRANAILMKGILFYTAIDLLISYGIASIFTDNDEGVVGLALIVFLVLNAAHVVISLKASITKGLYYWFIGRKDAVTALRATFAHYRFPKPDLMEESVETWMQKVVDRSDLDVAAKADALMLFSSARSPATRFIDRVFLDWAIEKAAEDYAGTSEEAA